MKLRIIVLVVECVREVVQLRRYLVLQRTSIKLIKIYVFNVESVLKFVNLTQ